MPPIRKTVCSTGRRSEQHPHLADLTPGVLARVSSTEGIDFATALLYDRLRRDRRRGRFIARVDAAPHESGPKGATVAVVPGAFYRSSPHTEADGRRLVSAARHAGFDTETVPLLDFGPLAANARILLDWLRARSRATGGPVLLASLSKGSAEVRLALAHPEAPAAFADVSAWVNFSGVPDGSLLADHLLTGRLRRVMTRLICLWLRADVDVLRQLTRGACAGASEGNGNDDGDRASAGSGPTAHAHPPESDWTARAPWVRVSHAVGFPLRSHLLTRVARRNHRQIARFGPNDGGGVLLADACRWPGDLYPVWGADHFMRPPEGVEDRVGRLLAAVWEEARQASHRHKGTGPV